MNPKFFGKAVLGAVVSLATVLGSAGSAQAATYKGTWDPLFGPPFSDLYWKGSADFNIPDTCTGAGWHLNTDPGCGGMSVTNAVVEFASSSDPLTTLQTLNFGSVTPATSMSRDASGVVNGAYTTFFGGIQGAIAQTRLNGGVYDGTGDQYYFALFFGEGDAYLAFKHYSYQDFTCSAPPINGCGVSGPAHITFVPEPQTYALMAAGLAAIGFVARRRRRG
jgi:PEP-CTERM motif